MAVNSAPGPVPGPNVPGPGSGPGPASAGSGGPPPSPAQLLDAIDEKAWLQLGSLAESMGEFDRAMGAYESALRHNNYSTSALNQIAELYRSRENFPKAAEYFQRILAIDNASGEVWGSLGHCYLMMDELQKAYNAYQNALHHLPNPKDSKLWYGIGILYDRYGSVEHAEEAFSAVMRMDPKYEKANEIYFRLGIIYKGQQKYSQSLECFRYILHSPPRPLTEADIWFQIGHVHEQQKEYTSAKEAYERVLAENPNHAKVLQQLGWLYHQQNAVFMNQDLAIKFLTRSIESDNTDAQSWYLIGRCYMAQQKYNKAYEAYQQAVYRDCRNPTFWCSIGLLYFQINQYRDALDAYSKAIRINPNISEVWYDLGTLYESCNNQVSDAIDAYQRALDLDPDNHNIKQRLAYLRQNNGAPGSVPPPPEEMNPNAYPPSGGASGQHFGQRSTVAPQGPPTGMQGYTSRQKGPPAPLSNNMNGEHPHSGRDLPLPGNGNGHGNSGQAGSPGYMSEDRQPHIPAINSGGPRPPTPAGAMPQMMTNDRMQGPPPLAPSSGPGHARPSRGRPPSPGSEGPGPYPRPGSPSMPHPSNGGHNHHDSPYPYGHGPPPPHNVMHGGPPQGYERQDQGPGRPKQEQPPLYQHQRQRSGDLSRPGLMEEGHGGPHPQRHHHSDPHAHAPSPPRDDRRAMSGPGSGPGGPGAGYNQGSQPPHHNPDDRWVPSSGPPQRHPSEDQGRDGGSRPPSSADRGQGLHPNSMPDSYQARNERVQPSPHSMDHDRRDQRPSEHHSPSFSRPGSEQGMRDMRSQGNSYDEQQQQQQQQQGQGHIQGRSRDFDAGGGFPDQGRGQSNWSAQDNRGGGYKTEEQDQDEIAASLVSLSGKPPSRAGGHGGQDDDYEMREAEQPVGEEPRHAQRGDENPMRHVHEQHGQHPLHEDPSSYEARDQHPSSRPGSMSRQYQEQPSEQQRHGSIEQETNEEPPRSGSPQHGFAAGSGDQGRAPSMPREAELHSGPAVGSSEAPRAEPSTAHEEFTEAGADADSLAGSGLRPGSGLEEPKGAEPVSSYNGSVEENGHNGTTQAPAGAGSEAGTTSAATGGEGPGGTEEPKRMPAEDEDTEMEEGEVREDEDEVMSSGAVLTAHKERDDAK